MPFVPSSPIRLYATRRSKACPTTETPSTSTISRNTGTKKLRDTFPSINLRTIADRSSSSSTVDNGDRQSPSRADLASEDIHMNGHLPRPDFEGAEGTLSIHEALATGALVENATLQEPSSVMIRPQSTLFDNVSESEYSVEEDVRPVVGRASSVRVSKPQIVENKPTKTSKFQVKESGHSRSNSRSSLKAERVSDVMIDTLPTMLEDDSLQYSGQTIRPVTSEDAEDASPSSFHQSFETAKSPLPASACPRNPYEEPTSSVTAYNSALPTGSTLHSIHPRIVQPDISSVAGVDEIGVSHTRQPERTMTASLRSPGQGLSRRVTIRPADLITKNHHDRSLFRETVVTTPYPPRLSDEITSMEFDVVEGQGSGEGQPSSNRQREKQRQRISLPNSARERDRFPSPERPEVLFLDLSLHNHPGARVTLEIEITDRTTFDDEALFKHIKAVYQKQLLNWPRRIFGLVRKTTYVIVTGGFQSTHSYRSLFNSAEFLQHIHNPHLGRRRKIWVLWLRNQNASLTSTQTSRIRHIDNLTRLSTRARSTPHSRHSSQSTKAPRPDKDEHKRLSTASDASSFYFAYSPMIARLPFFSTGHENDNVHSSTHRPTPAFDQTNKSPCRSFFWPGSIPPVPDCESPQRLTITIHHSFRLSTIVILTLLNFLFAMLCAAIWILFGVPGTRPGSDSQQQIGEGKDVVAVASDWRVNSQGRVLTGVVIGFVVLLLGSLGEGLLLWMGWLLL